MPDNIAAVTDVRQGLYQIHTRDAIRLIYAEMVRDTGISERVIRMQLVNMKSRTNETYSNQQHQNLAKSAGQVFCH